MIVSNFEIEILLSFDFRLHNIFLYNIVIYLIFQQLKHLLRNRLFLFF